jgi:lipopolysaccharide/colanic/teichoic acid biosynthesis glycosyltransferase
MIKRLLDILLSFLVLLLALPLLIGICLLIWWRLGSPVFFCQVRPGKDAKPFKMVKFRTMLSTVDNVGALLPDEQRMTALGRFLRSSSLDELPELWNVLKGDMSLVGPRPLLMEYLPLYTNEQSRRHEVLPGMTGWAQINGRNAISWEEKFRLDVWYVDNCSLCLNVKILCYTAWKVIAREGISADGEATVSKFTGKSD